MELPHIGGHCSLKSCNRLDLLPITCYKCKQQFCKEHSEAACHLCPSRDENCNPSLDEVKHVTFQCSLQSCKSTMLASIYCFDCMKHFCIMHRLPVDHCCSHLEQEPKTRLSGKEKVESLIGRDLSSSSKKTVLLSEKSQKTALKVLEIKLKMKSKGDENNIPIDKRVYFHVIVGTDEQMPMFFHKEWTIGKVVDWITKSKALRNENNVPCAKKWRLFSGHGKNYLPPDLILKNILGSNLYNVSDYGVLHLQLVSD